MVAIGNVINMVVIVFILNWWLETRVWYPARIDFVMQGNRQALRRMHLYVWLWFIVTSALAVLIDLWLYTGVTV